MCEYITSAKPFDFLCRSGSIIKKKGIEYVFMKAVRLEQILIKKVKQKVFIVPHIN